MAAGRSGPRKLAIEPFEERALLAVGPQLVAVIPSQGTLLDDNQVLNVAPTELTFRFDSDIDPNSLFNGGTANVQITRGGDHILGNGNDVSVAVGYVGVETRTTDVVVRFANSLPDDLYQIRIVGSGSNPLENTDGEAFNGGQDLTRKFTLDLGAQVVAVVPQPVTRNTSTNALSQSTNTIEVYFNANDPLDATTATNRVNYELIRTAGTATSADDVMFNPTSVTYDAASGKAVLTFASGVLTTAGLYRLRVGNNDPLPLTPVNATVGTPGSSFSTAADLGALFPVAQGTQNVNVSGTVGGSPISVIYPGGPNDPGSRDIPTEIQLPHTVAGPDTSGVIPVYAYNFKRDIGTVLGAPAVNTITEVQKQRAREVLSYYSYYLGVEFVETADSGLTIATGDPRAADASIVPTGVSGVGGPGLVVMNAGVDWGQVEPGGSYFTVAMHEVGHALGLGHTDELPPLTIQAGGAESTDATTAINSDTSAAEGVFPGDADIVLGQYLHPPAGNDVRMYKFSLARAGTLNVETIAERMREFNSAANPSQLDSIVSIFDSTGTLIARNDDYYGNDSFVQLKLSAGTFYVAVTSTGNANFNPAIPNTGFGGTTQGNYQLRLTFTPASTAGIKDATGTALDGDADGTPGGNYDFWFRVASTSQTLFVDKAATGITGTQGSITNPYRSIALALAAASSGSVVRIVGNGGADHDLATVGDNLSYNVGFDNIGRILSDGSKMEIPRGVTVMVDAGAIIKLHAANIDVGTSEQGINRDGGALQVLGTTAKNAQGADIGSVYITSFYNTAIGTDTNTAKGTLAKGDWGGLVFRDDSDLEKDGIFLNFVNHAAISYGGGRVVVNSVLQTFDPIHLITARPRVSYNTLSNSANAAMSADPNSFQESEFQGPGFAADYTRSGPKVVGNSLSNNSIKGLFVRIKTNNGASLDPLTVSARFSTTDMVYVIEENLIVNGQPGGYYLDSSGRLTARPDARLAIDPGVIVKMGGARIETGIGAELLAEGTSAKPIIFTSVFDDRYGAGGAFDTTNDGSDSAGGEGDWGGLFFGPLSIGSVDHALITFAGGATTIEGGFAQFNAVEIHQAQVRIANSVIERNAAGGDTSIRAGRGSTTQAVVFVRGAQPVIVNNVIRNNDTIPPDDPDAPLKETAAISINVNALNAKLVTDLGRSTGFADIQVTSLTNSGPLIRGNRIGNTPINGMVVRGGRLTTDSVWDDTDIVHVVLDNVEADTQFALSGRLRLQSSSTESLIVKLLGANAGITASGVPLDINDRSGGAVQIIGVGNHPVVMTSLFDDSVGAGFTPDGEPQKDTHNVHNDNSTPTEELNSGPVFIDGGDRDDHGSYDDGKQVNVDGWKFLEQAINFAYTNSQNVAGSGVLAIGVQNVDNGTAPRAQAAIQSAVDQLGLTVTFVKGTDIANVNFSQYKVIYIPSDAQDTQGGITNDDIDRLTLRKGAVQNYVNNVGGGLVALTEDGATNPYSWLALPEQFTIKSEFGVELQQTPLLAAAGFNITDKELSAGTPWHNSFVGPPGFNRLQVWVIDPVTGAVVTLGSGPLQGGIGTRLSNPQAGDWRSVKLDDYSNDRNVDVVNETEQGFAPTGDTSALPSTAQYLGSLAKDIESGDDVNRLGFEIHGSISQTVTSPKGGDVDVYSFQGTAGSVVWFDIDRTAQALDSVVELVDANGAVVARSNDSNAEQANPSLLVGIAQPMQAGFVGNPGPFTNPDFYSTNPMDAGMRLILPGTAGSVNTYFVRVRANSSDLSRLSGGLSKGEYVLQVRLQNLDEFPGSVVRNADIRYASTGVEVIGKPAHSPLQGDTASSSLPHNTFDTAQDLGNLLTTDQNEIGVAGKLASATDVQWFKMDLDYDLIQSIGGYSNGLKTFAATFNISYADGLARPDTTISVFDANGNLILIARNSDVPDAQPVPDTTTGSSNLSHTSYGVLDPTLGSVQLPAGGPQSANAPDPTFGGKGGATYYIAVSSAAMLPTILDATFTADATDHLVRLEPVDSTARVVDDRIGSTGDTTSSTSQQAFPGTTPVQLNASAVPYTLSDVVLYVATLDELYTVNPFTGQISTYITDPTTAGIGEYLGDARPGSPFYYQDIAMRSDGRLYSFQNAGGNSNTTANNSTYAQFDPATADTMEDRSDSPFNTFVLQPDGPINTNSSPRSFNFVATDNDPGIHFNGMAFSTNTFNVSSTDGRMLYAVGNRTDSTATLLVDENPTPTPDVTTDDTAYTVRYITEAQNLLFRLDANTGGPLDADLYTNTTTHPPQGDVTNVAYNGYPNDVDASDILAGSGTQVVPRGGLATQIFLTALPGNQVPDSATFTIDSTSTSFGVDTHETPVTFEFDSAGDGVTAGNIPIVVTASDTQADVAAAIVKAINDAGVPRPFGDPLISSAVGAEVQASGGQLGSVVKLSGSTFASVDPAFTTDSQLEVFSSGGSNPSFSIFDTGIAQGDITGLAFSGTDTSLPPLYAVSDTGGFYRVIGKDTTNTFFESDYELDNNATLQLLNVVTDPVFGGPVRFTGLTNGPANVEQGRYDNLLFATDDLGRIWAFDQNGKPAPVFVNGQTWVSTVPIEDLGRTGFFTEYVGLAFSSLDSNLWHVEETHSADPGHGLTRSYDFADQRNPIKPDDPSLLGGNSYYFGLTDLDKIGTGSDYNRQPGADNYLPSSQNGNESLLLSGNPSLYSSYNLPGGAYGSLMSSPISLEGYSAGDQPTLYFNYAGNTDLGDKTDAIRVYASTDGAKWTLLSTNVDTTPDWASADSSTQQLFDPAGTDADPTQFANRRRNDIDQPLPTTLSSDDTGTVTAWRQARVDMSAFAGQSNIHLRFDFSTGGSMGIGDLMQGGVYLAAADAQKITDKDTFKMDDDTFTFREGFSLNVPAGGAALISNGETFTVGTKTYEFTRTGSVGSGNVPILINNSQSAQQVADRIAQVMLANPASGVTPVRDQGYSLQVPPGGGYTLINGEKVTINGTTIELRSSGDFGGNNLAVPIDAELTLRLPATGGAGIINGESFTINNTTFVFVKNGTATPGVIPYTNADTPAQISARIQTAINNAGIGVAAFVGQTNLPGDTLFLFNLSGVTTGFLSANHSTTLGAAGFDVTSTATQIASALTTVVNAAGIGVQAVRIGSTVQLYGATSTTQDPNHSLIIMHQDGGTHVQLVGATSVAQSASHAVILEGSALPGSLASTDIFYQLNWSADGVANAIATSLDATFTVPGSTDDPTMFTSSKVIGSTLRLWGHTVSEAGPLAYSDTLAGQTGLFYTPFENDSLVIDEGKLQQARMRSMDNAHEGVFIDDVIIGMAGRGEMVTGTFNPNEQLQLNAEVGQAVVTGVNTFTAVPQEPGVSKVLSGSYQLDIRRGTEYATSVGGAVPFISLYHTFDVNDRQAQGFTLVAPAASQIVDGQTFAITLVNGSTFTFEFDSNGTWNTNNYRVPLMLGDSATTVATRIAAAINLVSSSTGFDVKAAVDIGGDRVNLFGGVNVDTSSTPSLGKIVFNGLGDSMPLRIQGETILQGNTISHTLKAGIVVQPVVNGSGETGITIGSPGHTGSVINLPALNTKRLVPGVAVKDNLIYKAGQSGIVFSGSPTTEILNGVPFGRIVNNTIAQTRFGIQVVYNASPTLLNNIIAENGTGIYVDDSSPSTVIGASLYQNNTTNLLGPSGFTQTNALFLQAAEPLFVDSSNSNFYLKASSKAIDSSVDSVPERLAVQAVTSPLGIPPSPIKASDYDLLGQLRVDDPLVAPPNGVGSNVYKDRGALERADLFGPTAMLLNPVDNDAALLDRSQVVNQVVLVGQTLKEFRLQLNDAGLGIDDTTLSAAKFAITQTIGSTTTTLTPDVDYTIAVDDTENVIDILPAEGIWVNATYVITLNNSSDPIKDLAGNNLQPNDQSGATKFTIQLTDTAVSPWQNQTNKYDVNGDGIVSGIDALFVINHLLAGEGGPLPAVATVPPYLDVTGDGNLGPLDALQVINYLNNLSTVSSQSAPASPAAAVAAPVTAVASPAVVSTTDGETSTAVSPVAAVLPTSVSASAPDSASASAIAFSITVGASGTDGASSIDTRVEEASAAKTTTDSTSGSPTGSQQLAAVDDVWSSDDWDAADGDWDGLVSDLFDESDESEMAVA